MDLGRLPPHLVVLYEPRTSPRRGPRPSLTIDRVIDAGVALADAEGLAGVSMSKVAERLGFTTMSLYRYVRSKEDLLLLMADAANSGRPPAATPGSWRAGLETWARGIFATYRRHPWLLQIPMSGPPAGPSQLLWMEAALQNLAEVAIPEVLKLQIIQLLHGYARGEAQLSTDLGAPGPGVDTGAAYAEILRTVSTPEAHPALRRLLDTGLFDGPTGYDEDVDFGFGLATILAGVHQLVETNTTMAPGPGPS